MNSLPDSCGPINADKKNKLYLALDFACNNNCLFCVVDAENNRKFTLSTEQIIAFLESLKESGELDKIKFVELSGGEPTLRKDLFYIMEHIRAASPDVHFGLLSNGRNFVNPYFAEKLASFNLDWVYVPLHGHCAKLHEMQTRAKGSFKETILGVHNLFEYNVRTSLKTVVSSLNYRKMPDIIEFAATEFPDCRIFTIAGIDIFGAALRNKQKVAPSFSEIVPYIQKSIDAAEKYGMIVDVFSIPPCIFEEKYRRHICPQREDLLVLKAPGMELRDVKYQYGSAEVCKNCAIRKNCPGTWFTYFKEFGTHELKPVREELVCETR